MDLVSIFIIVLLAILILWAVNTYVPDARMKTVITVFIIVAIVLVFLKIILGISGSDVSLIK